MDEAREPIAIQGPDDPRLAPFRSLRARTEAGEEIAVADGLRVLGALVGFEAPITAVITTERDLEAVTELFESTAPRRERPPIFLVERALVSELVGYRFHGGVMASLEVPDSGTPLEALGERVLALDRLDKGDNVGAIARTALAFGFSGLLYDRAGTSPFGRSAIRVSRGCVFGLPVRATDDLAGDLSRLEGERGLVPIGASSEEGVSTEGLRDLGRGAFVLVLGNEGEGLAPEVSRSLATTVQIPTDPRVESLNVAAAAAILCHALRGDGPSPG